MKKAPNAQLFFGIAAFTFVGSIGFLFMQNQHLQSKRASVANMREQVKEQKQIFAKLDSSKKELEDLKTKLAHLEGGVPDAAYVPTMLKDLELVGKQHGIEVTGLRPTAAKAGSLVKDKEEEQKPYQPVDLELKGRGKYFDLVTFMQALNTFPKIVAVRTLGLAPTANGPKDSDRHLEMTMGLRAFVFKESAAAQALSAAATGAGPTISVSTAAKAPTTGKAPVPGAPANAKAPAAAPAKGAAAPKVPATTTQASIKKPNSKPAAIKTAGRPA